MIWVLQLPVVLHILVAFIQLHQTWQSIDLLVHSLRHTILVVKIRHYWLIGVKVEITKSFNKLPNYINFIAPRFQR